MGSLFLNVVSPIFFSDNTGDLQQRLTEGLVTSLHNQRPIKTQQTVTVGYDPIYAAIRDEKKRAMFATTVYDKDGRIICLTSRSEDTCSFAAAIGQTVVINATNLGGVVSLRSLGNVPVTKEHGVRPKRKSPRIQTAVVVVP